MGQESAYHLSCKYTNKMAAPCQTVCGNPRLQGLQYLKLTGLEEIFLHGGIVRGPHDRRFLSFL